jgi:hypothetical protein
MNNSGYGDKMRAQLEQRLAELKKELENGQNMLADLDARRASLKETLLRISGAVQVLEEELAKDSRENGKAVPQPISQAAVVAE